MRKMIRRLAIGLGLLIAVLVIAWTVVYFTGKKRLNQELAYWHGRGVDVQVDAGLEIDTTEAGDPRILRVIELYADVPEAMHGLIDSPQDATPEALAQAIAVSGDVLELVHKIADEDQAVWKGEVLVIPGRLDDLIVRLSNPRSIARLLDAEALVKASEGDLDAACDSIVAGLSIGRQVGEHHAMIAVLVEVVIIDMMLDRLEATYSHGGVPTQRAFDAIRLLDMTKKFIPTLEWEGVYMARVTTDHALSPWSIHDTAYSLRQYRRMTESIETDGVPLRDLEVGVDHPWWAMQYKLMEPALQMFRIRLLHLHARAEMAKTAILLRRYKIEHGAYPAALNEIEGPPIDPYSGQAFEYIRRGDGFSVISYMRGGGKSLQWEWEE